MHLDDIDKRQAMDATFSVITLFPQQMGWDVVDCVFAFRHRDVVDSAFVDRNGDVIHSVFGVQKMEKRI